MSIDAHEAFRGATGVNAQAELRFLLDFICCLGGSEGSGLFRQCFGVRRFMNLLDFFSLKV